MPASDSILRRLLIRPHLPKLFFVLVCLGTLGAVWASIASRRPAQPVDKRDAAAPVALAEKAAAEKLIPPPVADEKNFAAIPLFEGLIEKGLTADSSGWPDDYSRAAGWPRQYSSMAASPTGRKTGRLVTDLAAWEKAFLQSQAHPGKGHDPIDVSPDPDPAANAVAALAVLKSLEPYEPILKELETASQRPESRFNVHYDLENPWATLLPHLALVKRIVQTLALKASAEGAAGKPGDALRDAVLMLRLVQAPSREPTLVSQLVRVAGFQLALQPVWECLAERRWSEEQLKTAQGRLQQIDFIADLKQVLEAERAWGNLTIGLTRDKRPPQATTALMGPKSKVATWQKEADAAFVSCPRDWFDQEQRNYNQLFDERVLAGFDVEARRFQPRVAEANTRFVEANLRDSKNLVQDHFVFAKMLLVEQAKIHMKFAAAQTAVDCAVVACALERHRLAAGQFPSTLNELSPRFLRTLPHDLIDGKPLRYERDGEGGYTLYSIGWNEADDNGEPAFLASGRNTELKDGDWVWRYPARK